jgi:hypothetical protein
LTLYHGSCQCGATAFEVEADLEKPVMCNCSRCRRLGWAMAFAPRSSFKLLKDEPRAEYLFYKEVIQHQFCTICGIESFAYAPGRDGTPTVAININCLDGVDAHEIALKAHVFDGASA